jgi:hypothetical protein
MTTAEFAAAHGIEIGAAELGRLKLLGLVIRPAGWWREEEARLILTSDLPRAAIANALSISIGSVGRLRWALKQPEHS